jgi:hypothetical protein
LKLKARAISSLLPGGRIWAARLKNGPVKYIPVHNCKIKNMQIEQCDLSIIDKKVEVAFNYQTFLADFHKC